MANAAVRWQAVGADHVIPASEWIWVDAANPSTVQTANSTLKMQSKVSGTYSAGDTSNGQIAIINFGKSINPSGSQYEILCMSIDGGAGLNPLVQAIFTGTITIGGSPSTQVTLYAKVTPITASFAVSALTWANVVTAPSLTYGSALLTDIIVSQSQGFDNVIGNAPTELQGGWHPTSNGVFTLAFPTGTAFYGLQVEIKPTPVLDAGLTLSSTIARFISANTTALTKPILIRPLS
jgi:hypothetical protein